VKRRTALKQLGLGATAGLLLPPWLSSCGKEDPGPEINYDGVVGIIGAGAAGLIAADILRSKGVTVKIFEASNRVGGRISSFKRSDVPTESLIVFPDNLPFSDFPLEYGADLVAGTDSKWGSILNTRKVPLVDVRAFGSDRYVISDQVKTEAEAQLEAGFTTAQSFYTTFPGSAPMGSTVQQAATNAGVSSSMLPLINSWLGTPYGSSSDQIGAAAHAQALGLIEHDQKVYTLSANPMQDVLLSVYSRVSSSIQFGAQVQAITYSGDLVEITHSGGTESVNKLIVTVPVAVLKSGAITFTPGLPSSKLTALSRIGMQASMRVILEFKRNFWGEDSAFIIGSAEAPMMLNAGGGRSDLNKTLTVTINGPKAAELSLLPGDEVVQHIIDEMDVWFPGNPGKATENIRTSTDPETEGDLLYLLKDWSKDPLIGGGASFPLPGGTNADRTALAAPVNDKLFFAGEATDDTGEYGSVSGALKSGERVAFEVIDSIT
jgi:monoamine oxidase